jgi:hypothetical protein
VNTNSEELRKKHKSYDLNKNLTKQGKFLQYSTSLNHQSALIIPASICPLYSSASLPSEAGFFKRGSVRILSIIDCILYNTTLYKIKENLHAGFNYKFHISGFLRP